MPFVVASYLVHEGIARDDVFNEVWRPEGWLLSESEDGGDNRGMITSCDPLLSQ
jgi:hypothetical protein